MGDKAIDPATKPTRPLPKRSDRLGRFARNFPSLRGAPGIDPWQADVFARWVADECPSPAAFHAARFLLHNVWGRLHDVSELARQTGLVGASVFEPFDITAALDAWDDEHRELFIAWTMRPFAD